MDILLVIFVFLFIILISAWYSRHSKITLPGPRGFPVVGYIPFLAKDPHIVFQKLARKYGPIYKTVSDNQIEAIVKAVNDVSQLLVAVSWQCFFPWIRAFISFFKLGNNGKIDQALNVVKNFMRQEIEHHKSTIDSNNPRDFIDKYLVQIKKNENKKSSFKEDVLVDLGSVLIGTSTETVRVTLEWLLLTAAAFPDVQRKVQEEIEMVVGHERFPSWQDHVSMPYTEAAINELMRWKTIEPLIVLHYTLKDTRLNGYFIPKYMRVLPVLYAVDHSEELWGKDHDEYKPERMLSQDGKTVKKFEHLMPFLIGKRSCPGELMARIEIFRYFTAILQKFDLSMPVGKKADLHGIIGLTLQPPIQHICIKKRTS